MKYCFVFLLLFTSLFHVARAQAPAAISYQAVARTADGFPLSETEIIVKLSILANGINGTLMWEEEHLVDTDAFGLFALNLGEGASTGNGNSPTFALINWGAASYFLHVELDAGAGFEIMGTSQLLSVPYALYANRAGNIADAQITDAELDGTNLIITEGNNDFEIDLSSIAANNAWVETDEVVYQDQKPVGVGTAVPMSTLHVEGSVSYAVTQIIGPANTAIDASNHVILANVSGGAITITLPPASLSTGRQYTIKRYGNQPLSSSVTLLPINGETIETQDQWTLSGFIGQVLVIISDGSNWYILSNQTINP